MPGILFIHKEHLITTDFDFVLFGILYPGYYPILLSIQCVLVDRMVFIVDNEEIDEYNILNATYMAMNKALNALKKKPDYLLLDAVTIPDLDIKQFPIIKGDAKSISIAGASILAKVTRDRLMYKYDEIYPQYGFKHHKGYGTKEHYEAIEKYGITPIHRKSFLKNVL